MQPRARTQPALLALLLPLLVLLFACGGGGEESGAGPGPGGRSGAGAKKPRGPLRIVAVNEPLRAMAQRIGGDLVTTMIPAPRDTDPAYWQPKRRDIVRIHGADLILLNGAGYDDWTRGASLPISRVVLTGASFADKLIELDGETTHSHGAAGEHSHRGTAFTTWLNPRLAVFHAEAVNGALQRLLPQRAEELEANYQALVDLLYELDARHEVAVEGDRGRPLLGSHPVYQYLARRYGLNLVELHWEPMEDPGEEEWAALEELLETHPARHMLWEDRPHPAIKQRLEGLGVTCVVYSPCAHRPEQGDYFTVAQANTAAFEGIFAE